MRFTISREAFLKPLQAVASVVERRQTLPILSNLLFQAAEDGLSITGTDLEVELVGRVALQDAQPGTTTVPARKILEICRALPEHAQVQVALEGERLKVWSGRSRFTLGTLPSEDFPNVEALHEPQELALPQNALRDMVSRTHFAMALQDVRYFLIGVLLETSTQGLRAVATDGHRLATCDLTTETVPERAFQVIVPRKGVLELLRLLEDSTTLAQMRIGTNHIQVILPEIMFTSKLIDGRFPDYQRVIPQGGDKRLSADREGLRQALMRASILSSEKFRGVRLQLRTGKLRALAFNPEQEEAEEEMEADYEGPDMEIGFNVTYLLDALGAIPGDRVTMILSNPDSSCLMRAEDAERCRYVVMPMRL